MRNLFRRSPKPRSSDELDLAGQQQERPRRFQLPWSSRSSASGASPGRGHSPAPTTRLPTPTPLSPTRQPPVAPLPPVTSPPSEPPAVLVHLPTVTTPSPPIILPIERIWRRSISLAQEKLKEMNLPLLDLSDPTLKSAADIDGTVRDLKSNVKGGSGRLRKILKTIESYAKIVDTAIQSNPAITALVWAGVRAILQVRLNVSYSF